MTIRHAATTAELQAAWAASTFGDTIQCAAGAVFESAPDQQIINFENKGVGTDYITITTDGVVPSVLTDVTWPNSINGTAYHRVTTAEAANMPKFVSIGNQSVIAFRNAAHHIKFIGIEFHDDGTKNNPALIGNGDAENTVFPHHIVFESCFVHPFGEDGTFDRYDIDIRQPGESAFILNCTDSTWDRCAIQGWAGLHLDTDDKQNAAPILAITFNNCTVKNCLLEGAGPFFLGGGGELNPDNVTTGTGWSYTSATFANITNLSVGDLFRVPSTNMAANHLTPHYDRSEDKYDNPDGVESLVDPYCNGRVLSITPTTGTAGVVTFTNLTAAIKYHSFILYTFGATAGSFKITFMGSESTSIPFNFTKLQLLNALESCSTIDPGDVIIETAVDDGFPLGPTHIRFQGQWAAPTPINPPTMTSSTLTGGSVVVPAGIFADFSESFHNLQDSLDGTITDKPSNGAEVAWNGFQAHDVLVERNLFAHPLAADTPMGGWPPEIVGVKGFIETKGVTNATFNANVFTGEPTGFVCTVRNQGGRTPWADINGMTITNNLWVKTNYAVPLILADGTYESNVSSGILIHNNLCLNGVPPEPIGEGSGSFEHPFVNIQYGDDITITHNTVFNGGRLILVTDQGPATNVIIRDNLFRPYGLCLVVLDPVGGESLAGLTVDHNLIVNNKQTNGVPQWYDQLGLTENTTDGWTEDSLEAVPFVALSPNNDPFDPELPDVPIQPKCDIYMNPRLADSSLYKAGHARQASDGTDVGCNIPVLISELGFNPFTGQPVSGESIRITGKVVLSGKVTLS